MYTPDTWADGNPLYPVSAARMTNIENGLVAAHSNLTFGVAKSADYTASAGDCVLMTGAHTVTLPTPTNGAQCTVVALTATTTILRGGTDTITVGTSTALTSYVVATGLSVTLQYQSGVWFLIDGLGTSSTVTQTADYTAHANECVLMTGTHTVTLPTPPNGSQVTVVALTGTVTIARAGADTLTIGTSAALTTTTVSAGLTLTLQYLSGVWYGVAQSSSPVLTPTALSADYTAAANQSVLMTGAHAVTLPNAPAGLALVEVVALTGTVTINRAGSDTINVRGTGAQTTCSITSGCNLTLRYLSGVWYVVDGSQTLTPSPWVAPSLINSWANYGAPLETAGYMKDPSGVVHLKGLLKTGASGSVAFVLPAGYRPGATGQYSIICSGPTVGMTQIDASGNVYIFGVSAASSAGIAGVSFFAEA